MMGAASPLPNNNLLLLFFFLAFLALSSSGASASATLRRYQWTVQYSFWSPDCVEKVLLTINGQYPGPTIRVRAGDTVVIEIRNLLPTEAILMHWHGIRQRGTPWYDGAGAVSQCAIDPGETFAYKFVADKAGTYFYHGHLGLQRSAGFYGSLIVDVAKGEWEPFKYDGELSLVLNDWWHRSAIEQGLGLHSEPFRWVGEPQSLLIEGRGRYDCSLVGGTDVSRAAGNSPTCDSGNSQCSPFVLRVEAGKTYRLRIASVASLSSFNFQIEGHNMTVVEADGNYVREVQLGNLNVYSGESYSVLIKAHNVPPNGQKSFWVTTRVQGRPVKTPPGLAILTYVDNSSNNDLSSQPALPKTVPPAAPAAWNDTAFSLAQIRRFRAHKGRGTPAPPPKSDTRVVLLNTQNRVNGVIKWAINNVSFVPQATPALVAIKYRLKEPGWHAEPPPPTAYSAGYDIMVPPSNPNATEGSGAYVFRFNTTVDVVLQNANTLTVNNSEIHPWHLHGHDFWVLGYGQGVFDAAVHTKTFNLRDPPLRNTVPLFPYGWTAIRFVADNPGVWPFHCHLESHFHMGMGVLFAEGIEKLGKPPRSILGCGLTKKWIHV